jgi:hypothetical protein
MASGQNKVLASQEHITFGIWIIKKMPPILKGMKYILLGTLLILGGVSAQAQDLQTIIFAKNNASSYQSSGTLVGSYGIPAGKTMEVISMTGSLPLNVVFGNGNYAGSNSDGYAYERLSTGSLTGPATIVADSVVGFRAVTFRLKDNTSTTQTVPTSAVVIPTDATGPVDVILESSTDLVNWTQANPGTYGASTTKRFFRVRAVNQ